MPNLSDLDLSTLSTTPPGQSAPSGEIAASGNIADLPAGSLLTPEQAKEEKFGTVGQQVLTGVDGLGHGFAGPIATGIESGLTKLGVPGLSPEEQASRAEVNPVTHYGSEIAGFGAGALTGTGEARVVGKIGELAAGLTGLEKGATLAKIATSGIKAGAEVAAIQTGDEISKFINGDPNQTLGSAAINIGLSGLMGGGGGAALGSVSPLFKTAANKLGVTKLATDFMGELKILQEKPDVVAEALKEYTTRKAELEALQKISPELVLSEDNPASILAKRARVLAGPTPEIPFTPSENEPIKNLPRPNAPLFDRAEVKDLLNKSQKAADKIASEAIDNGTQIPAEALLNPTPILNGEIKKGATPGQLLARWAYNKGSETLAKYASEGTAGTIGGLAGALIGHPIVGAYVGDKILSPVFSALAKPIAENAVNSEALRASVDYLVNAVKGEAVLSKSVGNFFKSGEIVPSFLMPNQASRDKLQKSLDAAENPENIMQVGGAISHYLPDHGTAAAALAGGAVEYLKNLKPKQAPLSPFDALPPLDKAGTLRYNRALDIAQQPLVVLDKAKKGTLLPDDVATIQTLYPGLHSAMVTKLNNELISHKTAGKSLPYSQRVSLAMLTGSPLDSTMMPVSMQAIIRSAGNQISEVQRSAAKKSSGGTGAQLKAIERVASLYPTDIQQRQITKRK